MITYAAPASRIIAALTSPVNAPFALPVEILRRDGEMRSARRFRRRVQRGERRRDDDVDVAHTADQGAELLDVEDGLLHRLEHLPVAGDEWLAHQVLADYRYRRLDGYLSGSASTPGSVCPPRNSSDAPPPVEMCVMRSATPALLTAATESPPPMIVVPFTSATARATPSVPAANASISNTPIGPFHTTVFASRSTVWYRRRRLGSDVEAHAAPDRRIVHLEHGGRRARFHLVGDDVIDRERELHAAAFACAHDVARGVELVVLDQRRADRQPEGLEERVGHRAADEQSIDLAEKVLDDLDLVRHLGAAEDGDERPFGIAEGHAEIAQLLFHQQAGAGVREVRHDRRHRRMRAMRRAERVVDVDVGERRERPARSRRRSSLLRRGSEGSRAATTFAPLAVRCLHRVARRLSPTQSSANATSRPSSSPRRAATGFRLNSGAWLALRTSEVRREHDGRALVERVLDRRQRRRDPRVVGDRPFLDRDVEVDADEHTRVADRRDRESSIWSCPVTGCGCSRSTQRLE